MVPPRKSTPSLNLSLVHAYAVAQSDSSTGVTQRMVFQKKEERMAGLSSVGRRAVGASRRDTNPQRKQGLVSRRVSTRCHGPQHHYLVALIAVASVSLG